MLLVFELEVLGCPLLISIIFFLIKAEYYCYDSVMLWLIMLEVHMGTKVVVCRDYNT